MSEFLIVESFMNEGHVAYVRKSSIVYVATCVSKERGMETEVKTASAIGTISGEQFTAKGSPAEIMEKLND